MSKTMSVRPSPLSKRSVERHGERSDEIVECGTLDCWKHHGCRHAGIEPDVRQLLQLILIDLNERGVIGHSGSIVGQPIG